MKKLLSVALCLVLIFSALPVLAIPASAATDGYYTYYTVSPGETIITDVKTDISGDVVIPSELGGYPVTEIAYDAFQYCQLITSVTIPDSVRIIGESAFSYCIFLTSVTIPKNVTLIDESVFSNCTSLTTVTLHSGITRIGVNAFYDCIFLERVYYKGFKADKAKMTINSGNSSLTNAKWYYDECSEHIYDNISDAECNKCGAVRYYTYTVSNGEATITACDENISGDVTIPSTLGGYPVTKISDFAFQGCNSLNSVTIPDSVTSFGDEVFVGCNYLTSISFGNNLKYMGYAPFYGCKSLKNVILPDNLILVPMLAFYECTSLESIIIPDGVTGIGDSAFAGCSSLTSITILNPDCAIDGEYDEYTISDTATIYGYKDSTAQAYAEKYGRTFVAIDEDRENTITGTCGDDINWKLNLNTKTLYLTGTGITYNYVNTGNVNPFIEHRANIKTIIIGDGITHLGNRLFRGLTQVESVKFGKDVATMGYEVFYTCLKLKYVELNEGLTMLGALSFYNCTKLTQIAIPSTVTNINNRAFKGSGLTSVVVPDTVKTLGYEVFMNCASLETVDYTEGCSMLNPRMFENCTSLKTFNFTRNMCRIRSRAFYGCTALQSITFEDADNMWGSSNGSEAKIASNAFEGCNSTLQMIAKKGSHVSDYCYRRGFTFVAK